MKPWYFLVLNERAILEAIAGFHPYAAMLPEAPLAILVCGDREAEPMDGFLSQNCSAATENILLAAHALGLGATGIWHFQSLADRLTCLKVIDGYTVVECINR